MRRGPSAAHDLATKSERWAAHDPAGRMVASAASPFVSRPLSSGRPFGELAMPRYLVQRTFSDDLHAPGNAQGPTAWHDIVARNADVGVTWLQSYVSADHQTMVCLYEGPDPESIRKAAARNGLPVDAITEVTVLDPYGYR
jgi:hypothetical protein